ncbi:MAG: hypothetical protein ACRD07_19790 [Acidimicrobiales bacterium]
MGPPALRDLVERAGYAFRAGGEPPSPFPEALLAGRVEGMR